MMRQTMAAAQQQGGGAAIDFDVENDITWHSLFWAEGTAMTALAYGDTDAVTTWPNETGETNATGSGGAYSASDTLLNNKPAIVLDGTGWLESNFVTDATASCNVLVVLRYAAGHQSFIMDSYANANRYIIRADADTTNKVRAQASAGGGVSTTGTFPGGVAYGFRLESAIGGLDRFYVDGGLATSRTSGTNTFRGPSIGATYSGARKMIGAIALLAVYEGDITADPAWSAMRSWVSYYYGVTI